MKINLIILILLIGGFNSAFGQTTIRMKKESGVYVIPCSVNGLTLKFIFDTGASDVSISLTEALFMLKNGYLKSEDILGNVTFSDATGNISEGTKIILRKIEFNGLKITNVEASVVNELSAPILLGQTAIAKLGKFQFDPNNGTLTILNGANKTTLSNTEQTQSEIKYEGTSVVQDLVDNTYAMLEDYVANNVTLVYNTIQKSWDIKFTDIKGKHQWMNLTFIKMVKWGEENRPLMEDSTGNQYIVQNLIDDGGQLAFNMVPPLKDYKSVELVCKGVVKSK